MPLYEYKCGTCGFEFEELVKSSDADKTTCKKCGTLAEKKISRCAAVIAGGTSVETVDMTIGRAAEKQWQMRSDIQSKRRGGKPLQDVSLPKDANGKYMPVMGLGDKTQRENRKEYSSALQEHVKDRVKKGKPQFEGAGAF
jgi:putative FmdB family regulatory protein